MCIGVRLTRECFHRQFAPTRDVRITHPIQHRHARQMHAFEHGKSIEHLAGIQRRQRRQLAGGLQHITQCVRIHVFNTDDERRRVVFAAELMRVLNDAARNMLHRIFRGRRMSQFTLQISRSQRGPHAIADQRKHVARTHRAKAMIGRHRRIEPHGAREHMFHFGALPHVIGGEALQIAVAQQVDARVAHMREVIHAAAQHERGERSGHPHQIGAGACLRLYPAV